MRAFARSVTTQDALAIAQPGFVLAVRFAVIHQFFEDGDIEVLEPLAFVEATVLIPAFEQVATVEFNGVAQRSTVIREVLEQPER